MTIWNTELSFCIGVKLSLVKICPQKTIFVFKIKYFLKKPNSLYKKPKFPSGKPEKQNKQNKNFANYCLFVGGGGPKKNVQQYGW